MSAETCTRSQCQMCIRDRPKAMFIVDPHKERIAVAEARKLNIPSSSLATSFLGSSSKVPLSFMFCS